jgi:hypothetical protein
MFDIGHMTRQRPNRALQRTRLSRCGCNRGVPRTGSLILGRWASTMGIPLLLLSVLSLLGCSTKYRDMRPSDVFARKHPKMAAEYSELSEIGTNILSEFALSRFNYNVVVLTTIEQDWSGNCPELRPHITQMLKRNSAMYDAEMSRLTIVASNVSFHGGSLFRYRLRSSSGEEGGLLILKDGDIKWKQVDWK